MREIPRQIGPFTVEAPAGKGATAQVWRAVHRPSETPVAIKILTRGAEEPGWLSAFGREVRAVARLDHPAIIRVHDYGTLPAGLGPALDRRIPDGAPYLVMDWHGDGTLDARRGQVPFAVIRAALLTVLDALAHAHARGVVHRDLKPANVLLGARGPVLSDFGLVFGHEAHAGEAGAPLPSGTPNYMAPEQVSHDWRAFGPWTDLYALGCLGWALACGRAPFAGLGVNSIMLHHLHRDPPEMQPVVPVPAAFEGWLRRLLAKSPARRFRFAADAAVALMQMSAPVAPGEAAGSAPTEDDATVLSPPVFVALGETAWSRGPVGDTRPPRPENWRRPPGVAAPHLAGCGRSLAELREMRLRGRHAERDRLWRLLGQVVDGRGARLAVLDGPAGIGKSRLMDWLAERAHELGQARTGHVAYGPGPGPAYGLRPLFARMLRLDGLAPDVAGAHIARRLGVDAPLAAALAALQSPDLRATVDGFGIALAEREVPTTIIDGLAAVTAGRPLVLRIDDAQWGDPAVRLVQRVLDDHPALPVLFVMTARPPAQPAERATARMLEALTRRPAALRIALGPLDPTSQGRSAGDRLTLDPETGRRLVELTRGNPLFAGELLRHWLHTDALTGTADGHRLTDPTPQPPTLSHLIRMRLDALLAGLIPDPSPALELAAVLGTIVDPTEWAAVREQAGAPDPAAAVERLLDAGLVEQSGAGLVFRHAVMREALRDRARDAGRLARWHEACAAGLAVHGARHDRPPDPVRRALHLEAAGHAGAAFPCWQAAIEAAEDAWGAVTAADTELLAGAMRTGRRMGLTPTDPAWLSLKISWSAHLNGLRRGLGLRHARQAVDRALRRDRATAARALRQYARCLRDKGDLAGADARLADSEALCEALGEPISLGATRLLRAMNAYLRDDLDTAEALLAALLRRLADKSVPRVPKRRLQMTNAWNQLGEIRRRRGDLEAAAKAYRQALRILGPDDTFLPALLQLNLALIDLARDDPDAARKRARRAHPRLVRAGNPRYRIYAEAVLLACAAEAGDGAAWDRAWGGLGPVRALDFVYLDVARLLDRAGRRGAEALAARAASARAIAIRQYRALGRVAEADALAALTPEA